MGRKLVADMTPEEIEHKNAVLRAWRKANPDRVRKSNKKQREADPGKMAARVKRWCATNVERSREHKKNYEQRNREKVAAKNRRWFANNADKAHRYSVKHCLKQRGALIHEAPEQIEAHVQLYITQRLLKETK